MKYLGFLPREVPSGRGKLAYYTEAGFQKIMPRNKRVMAETVPKAKPKR